MLDCGIHSNKSYGEGYIRAKNWRITEATQARCYITTKNFQHNPRVCCLYFRYQPLLIVVKCFVFRFRWIWPSDKYGIHPCFLHLVAFSTGLLKIAQMFPLYFFNRETRFVSLSQSCALKRQHEHWTRRLCTLWLWREQIWKLRIEEIIFLSVQINYRILSAAK